MNQAGSGAGHYSLTETIRRYVEKFKTMGMNYRGKFGCEGVKSRVEDFGQI